MADFKRKPGESFEGFLRKFKKGLKNSKRLEKARSKKHLVPKKSKRQQKNYALNSLSMRQEKEYLRKIGKLEETQNR
jgi:ribosomal protein S21